MGEVIARKAARDKIIEDTSATLVGAAARAEKVPPWAGAQARLGPSVRLYQTTAAKLAAAEAALVPLTAARDALDDSADDLVKREADEIWNAIGRPGNDPAYEQLFPAGAGFYTDAPLDEQPELMLLLAELLESDVLPPHADGTARAARIRTAAERFGDAVDAMRRPAARVRMYDRMLTSTARAAHVELAKFKRYLKSEGLSEADIHAVIPDRPRSYGVQPEAPKPAPARAPATP